MEMRKPIKVIVADPTFDERGLGVPAIPLGAGLIGSYLKHHLPETDVRIIKELTSLLKTIREEKPDILGLTNYMWNTNLCVGVTNYAREIHPDMFIVSGGPELDSAPYDLEVFKKKYKSSDMFIHHEGEVAFLQLVKKYMDAQGDIQKVKESIETLGNCFYVGAEGNIVKGPALPRIEILDDVPSPYLMGLFDHFLADNRYIPMVQTNRGCPFSCTFCQEGATYFTRVKAHSLDFITKELDYIAHRVDPKQGLFITDSNWAMYEEDVLSARHLAILQERYGWPKEIISSTGKANLGRIIEIGKILNGAMFISNSVQSMNTDVLQSIKRKNLKAEDLERHKADLITMRQEPEIIIPLPRETKETFIAGLNQLLDAGTRQRFAVFQCIVLSNTELGQGTTVRDFNMVVKFRQHSNLMGYVNGKFVCETERVIVSTSTMSKEEVCDCRIYSMLLDTLLRFEPVDEIFRLLDSKNIKRSQFTRAVFDSISRAPASMINCIEEFKSDFWDEMFDTEEEVLRYMEKHVEDYQYGIKGGGNLKSSNRFWSDHLSDTIEWLFSVLKEVLDQTPETEDEIRALKDYLFMVYVDRLEDEAKKSAAITKQFDFDIKSWYESKELRPLGEFKYPVVYSLKKTEISQIDKLIVWQSFGFKRGKTGFYTEVGSHIPRLYAKRLRRDVEIISPVPHDPSQNEKNIQTDWVGKLTIKL